MISQDLKDYIDQSHQAGISDREIRNALLGAGWDDNQINQVLPNETPSPQIFEIDGFVNKWSWGGFLMTWLYFVASRLAKKGVLYLLGSFVPILNIYLWIKSGLRGRKIVWQSGKWQDFESYKKRQRILDKIGFVVLLAVILTTVLAIFLGKEAPDTDKKAITSPSISQNPTQLPEQKQNCGSISESGFVGTSATTEQESAALLCMGQAIVDCRPAVMNILGDNAPYEVVKSESNICVIRIGAKSNITTCDISKNFLADLKQYSLEQNKSLGEVPPGLSWFMAFGEATDIRTGTKIKLNCQTF